jgi:predicted PurR-regulated permease PerM
MGGLFDRFRRGGAAVAGEAPAPDERIVTIDATSLSRVFSAPMWLRDLGLLAWFLVGVGIVLVGLVWLLGLTSTIVDPVVVGAILATVAGPLVTKLQARRVPRAAAAALVLLGLLALAVLIALLVFGGIVEQWPQIEAAASEALDKIEGWANDSGADGTSDAKSSVQQGVSDSGHTLVQGLANGISGLTSMIFFLTFTLFSTFFLLKDGPVVRRFVDTHLGVPSAVATTITTNVIRSLRRYFLGVTIVAAFNAVVVGGAAYLLDVPLAGTIAVVTFATAYIPFIGAFVSGAFAVMLALSSQGTTTALIMLVVVILANGLLQNIVQPIAFGATLDLNPLVVLIATIGLGSLFGMIGLVLGAPLTSAALHISRDLAAAKAAETAREESEHAPPGGAPTAAPTA